MDSFETAKRNGKTLLNFALFVNQLDITDEEKAFLLEEEEFTGWT